MNITKNNYINQESLYYNQTNIKKSLIAKSSDLSVKSLSQILLKNPNLVNIIDNKGETLLTYSIKKKKIDTCQLILASNNLDLSYQDKNGNSYLHLAVINQFEDIVKELIEKGININIKNNNGNTALQLAYLNNNIAIINNLKNNHINTKIKNNDNKFAEDLKENKQNDNQEIKYKNNKQKSEKKFKSNIKDNKLRNHKKDNNKNNFSNNLTINYDTERIKSYNENISNIITSKTMIKKNILLNDEFKIKSNNQNKNTLNNIKKEKSIKKDNDININIKYPNLTEGKKKIKKIINNNNINNNKNIDDNFNKIKKNLNNIDLGNNTSDETKYKSGIYKDKINNEEKEELYEVQEIDIKNKNKEEQIFNISQSIDYKKKLEHTSELNTQIVKSPKKVYSNKLKKNIKGFKEDDFIKIKDNNINENNDIDEDNEEEENEEKEIIKYNENIFKDQKYLNSYNYEINQYEKQILNYNHFNNIKEDEYKGQNESTLNIFENSLLNSEHQQNKIKNINKNKNKNNNNNISENNNYYKNINLFYSLPNEIISMNNLNNQKNLYKNEIDDINLKNDIRKTFTNKYYNNNDQIIYKFNEDHNQNNNENLENKHFDYSYYKDVKNISNIDSICLSSLTSLSDLSKIIINKNIKPLIEFLSQLNMLKYINNFIRNGFNDINLIIDQAKKGIYITDNELKEAGIIIPGDRAKILIRIQEKAGYFSYNVPKNVYYSCNDLNKAENDINVIKLKNWLKNLKIEFYLRNFVLNGYHSIELLLLQMESINPLTVGILKEELGIEKIGHRSRIINKLKEEGRSYNNKLKTSILVVGDGENTKNCECLIY